MIDGRAANMEIGAAYEINNQLQHSVMNKGKEGRVNFIFDYIPPRKIKEIGLEITSNEGIPA